MPSIIYTGLRITLIKRKPNIIRWALYILNTYISPHLISQINNFKIYVTRNLCFPLNSYTFQIYFERVAIKQYSFEWGSFTFVAVCLRLLRIEFLILCLCVNKQKSIYLHFSPYNGTLCSFRQSYYFFILSNKVN